MSTILEFPKQDGNKAQKVNSLFSSIASKYDLINNLISFGQLHLWRKKLVKLATLTGNEKVLDVATGTGDLAIVFKQNLKSNGEVVGVDFCAPMIELAPNKAKQRNLPITFQLGDATNLQFSSGEFDRVSIAFGLRNVADYRKAISEMSRVLKPKGKLLVLETGRSSLPVFSILFDFYFSKIMPLLGGLFSGDFAAYKYLDQSSQNFPYGEKLKILLLKNGGFHSVTAHPLFGGVSYIYVCEK